MASSVSIMVKTLALLSVTALCFSFAYLGHESEVTLHEAGESITAAAQGGLAIKNATFVSTQTTLTTNGASSSGQTHAATTYRVLCYGDSLTAGVSGAQYYPYSDSLQQALDEMSISNGNNDVIKYDVHHVGLPGWTTRQFLAILEQQDGLQYTIQKLQSVDLVLLLAGTNDLPFLLDGLSSDEVNVTESANQLSHNLLQLHQAAWSAGVPHTIALGIPGSAYQETMSQAAARLAQQANEKLERLAAANPAKMTFVKFPFPFVAGGDKWSSDGLHFSQAGYRFLGQQLAPVVAQIASHPPIN